MQTFNKGHWKHLLLRVGWEDYLSEFQIVVISCIHEITFKLLVEILLYCTTFTCILLSSFYLKVISKKRKMSSNVLKEWIAVQHWRHLYEICYSKDVTNDSGSCLHDIQDEVQTIKHNWLAQCQFNVTGWVTMWGYDMLSQWDSIIKMALGPNATNIGTLSHRYCHRPCGVKQLVKIITLRQSGKSSLMSWLDVEIILQTNKTYRKILFISRGL